MPVKKVRGGFKVGNQPTVHKTRGKAVKQNAAIKISQKKRGKKK